MSREGYIYLLHFKRPISPNHTTQHYLGFCYDLDARIREHRAGVAARLTQVARQRGIGFTVARVWRGDRTAERQLKNRKEAPTLCPICDRHSHKRANHLPQLSQKKIRQLVGPEPPPPPF